MNGSDDFKLGERFANLEGKVDSCLKGIDEIKSTVVEKVHSQHDDILIIKEEISTFKKLMYAILAPIFTAIGTLIWGYFGKK